VLQELTLVSGNNNQLNDLLVFYIKMTLEKADNCYNINQQIHTLR